MNGQTTLEVLIYGGAALAWAGEVKEVSSASGQDASAERWPPFFFIYIIQDKVDLARSRQLIDAQRYSILALSRISKKNKKNTQ